MSESGAQHSLLLSLGSEGPGDSRQFHGFSGALLSCLPSVLKNVPEGWNV